MLHGISFKRNDEGVKTELRVLVSRLNTTGRGKVLKRNADVVDEGAVVMAYENMMSEQYPTQKVVYQTHRRPIVKQVRS